MTLSDFKNFHTVESSYKKERVPNFMLMGRAVSEIRSTRVSFLGIVFAAKTRKTTGFPGVCGFPTTLFP